jgi:hypothetical protein
MRDATRHCLKAAAFDAVLMLPGGLGLAAEEGIGGGLLERLLYEERGSLFGDVGAEEVTSGAEYDLYHGTNFASAQDIAANGIDAAKAARYGGGDTFWTTTTREHAELFARSNPIDQGATHGVVGMRLTGGVQAGLDAGVISPFERLPGVYTVNDWDAFNVMTTFHLLP